MSPRSIILLMLKIAAGLTALMALSGIVWLLLAVAGDRTGAAGARGVFWIALAGWLLNFVLLGFSVAWSQVRVLAEREADSAAERPPQRR